MIKKIINKVKQKMKSRLDKISFDNKIRFAKRISDKELLNYDISDSLKVALHFHVFYVDLIEEIYSHIKCIRHFFTLVITTTTETDVKFLNDFFAKKEHKNFNIIIKIVENRGRDIYPFYQAFSDTYENFDIIGHFHTKKSLQNNFGNDWRKFLYDNLLGYDCLFDNIITTFFKNKKLGFITSYPFDTPAIRGAYFYYSKKQCVKKDIAIALNRFIPERVESMYKEKYNKDFPCGNMFIARKDAIKQFFTSNLTKDDFPTEEGQLTGTLQHWVELMWKYIVEINGFNYREIRRGF